MLCQTRYSLAFNQTCYMRVFAADAQYTQYRQGACLLVHSIAVTFVSIYTFVFFMCRLSRDLSAWLELYRLRNIRHPFRTSAESTLQIDMSKTQAAP